MPTFTVETAELKKKVNFLRNALGASKTDLAVQLFRVSVEGNKATMFAAGKELFGQCTMKVFRDEAAENGQFAVMGEKLVRLAAESSAEKVALSWDQENLQVVSGFLTVNFELYDDVSIRTTQQAVQPCLAVQGIAVTRDTLEEALVCARSCTTATALRPDVTHAELRGGRMLSSDGRKIMIYATELFDDKLQLKVPAAVLGNVVTAVKNIELEKVEMTAEPESYYVIKGNLGEYALGVRKTERVFPQVEQQITEAAAPDDEVSIDQNILEGMLRGVAMGLPNDEVKVTLTVSGEDRGAALEVSAHNSLGRKSFEKSSVGRKGKDPVSFPVSYKHLTDTLSVFKGDSVVDLLLLMSKSMVMVKDSTETREVMTIIPFRTDKQIELEKKEREQLEEERKKQSASEEAETQESEGMVDDAGTLSEDDEIDLGAEPVHSEPIPESEDILA